MNEVRTNKNVFKLVCSALLLAVAVVIGYFSIMVPIGGAPVLRISLSGPPLKYIGILFGPLYGGVAGALADVIGFLLKPINGFLWPLTVVAFLKGLSVAWLWKSVKNISFKVYSVIYISVFTLLVVAGVANLMVINMAQESAYAQFITTIGKRTDYVSIGLIIAGVLGLAAHCALYLLVYKKGKERAVFENYLRLVVAVVVPGMVFTTVNTVILQQYLLLGNKAFFFVWIPRFVEEIIVSMFNVYVLAALLRLNLVKQADL